MTHSAIFTRSILAFPSLFEGWRLSLTEAMAHGLPTVGFGNPSGVKSLIQHELTGYLAGDENRVDSFAYYLDKLMASEKLRESTGRAGMEFVKEYHPDLVYDQ